jgi:hypothetical protein
MPKGFRTPIEIGQVIHNLTVISIGEKSPIYIVCLCEHCDEHISILKYALFHKKANNCDCELRKARSEEALLRGATYEKHRLCNSPTYHSWVGMKDRCLNPEASRFMDWGGRGITVCEEWLDFRNFLRDMGIRPLGKTLDRIDVNGNYTPDNCRWADAKTQRSNHRNTPPNT